jgi:predicted phage terminase large subunit-like protein
MTNYSLLQQAAAQELLKRRRARKSLLDYAKAIDVPGKPLSENEDEWLFAPVETGLAAHHVLILEVFEKVILGEIPRGMFFLPPGSAKSTYGSVVAPTWAMGINAGTKIILASYGADLARKNGRRARQIARSPQYKAIFDTVISSDTAAADEWATINGSEYLACGILSGVTGNRAHGLIIDDPIKGRQEADSDTIRARTWDTYQEDLRTRLVPGGWEIIIQCMAGDTQILMADGCEKPLRDIRQGDRVATYKDGKISISTVSKWANSGPDRVFKISMESGTSVKANARHPFLVEENGEKKWQRTDTLKKGSIILKAIGENGVESNAPLMDATKQLAEFVQSANSPQQKRTPAPIGIISFVSIIVTIAKKLEVFFVMTVIWLLATEKLKRFFSLPLNTYKITRDKVIDVIESGVEDVFDVQIDQTENFIANGLVSHNTRWHEDDLAGRILPENYNGKSGLIRCRDGRDWYIVCIPAQCDRADDPLGRKIGDYLWPEWFSEEHFKPFKAQPRTWNALFQQRPQPEMGTYFQRDWFKRFKPDELPKFLHLYGSSDYAVTDDGGDFTEHGIIGVAPDGDLWIKDWWAKQTEADVWIDTQLDMIKKHTPFCWFGEAGVIKKAINPFLYRRMMERNIFCRMEWIPSVKDKPTRARAFQARASAGKVHLPEGEVGDRIVDQCIRAWSGRHDDAIDVLSLFCLALDQAHPAIVKFDPTLTTTAQAHISMTDRVVHDTFEQAAVENAKEEERFWNNETNQDGRTYSDIDGH